MLLFSWAHKVQTFLVFAAFRLRLIGSWQVRLIGYISRIIEFDLRPLLVLLLFDEF